MKIGILGGGQLGAMTAVAAAELGFETHIYCPSDDSPAFQTATTYTQAAYDDKEALAQFGRAVDVVTFEFENIPRASVEILEQFAPVRPNWQALWISQNRLREKNYARELGIQTPYFVPVHTVADLESAPFRQGILKTTELGYDGKGQLRLDETADLVSAWKQFGAQEAIFEALVPFQTEISAIVARGLDGQIQPFPVPENHHVQGILCESHVPAQVAADLQILAQQQAAQLAESLDLVGLLAVEFFVTQDGTLLFNEMAPRPHNSGHWTMDACSVSQFEQFVRAVCGLELLKPETTSQVKLRNIIGDDALDLSSWETLPNARLHMYGKKEVKPGRKMGHVNVLEGA